MFTQKQQDFLDRIGVMLDAADVSNDAKAKVDKEGKYVRTPWALCQEIVKQVKLAAGDLSQSRVCVVDTVEFIPMLLMQGVNKNNITFVAPYEFKGKIAAGLGATALQCTLLDWETDMKFDVIVGNPPYQDKNGNENSTNSTDLYTKFINRSLSLTQHYVALVVPSAWTGPRSSSLKKVLFEEHQPILLNTHGKKWFDVSMNTCYFITEKHRKGHTMLTDAHNNAVSVLLDTNSAIPSDLSVLDIQAKISHFSREQNLASVWLRGKLHLNQIVECQPGVEFIAAVGIKNGPLTINAINIELENTGYGRHKVVLPNLGGADGIGNVKIAEKTQVGGHSVVFLTTSSDAESANLKAYLASTVIKFLLKAVKISTPNSKKVFSFIPKVDFTKTWSDSDLYTHFNLTQEEIDYIEANVK